MNNESIEIVPEQFISCSTILNIIDLGTLSGDTAELMIAKIEILAKRPYAIIPFPAITTFI